MAKKIVFLTQFFYPEINSTAKLLYELAEDLNVRGIGVKVYAKEPAQKGSSGLRDDYNGISVRWLKTSNFPKSNFLGRSVNYIIFFVKLAAALLFARDNSPCLVLSSPPFLPLIAYLLKRVRARRYYYLVHDLYPDVAVQLGYLKKNGLPARLWARFNSLLIREAERVIVLDESMRLKVESYAAAADREKIVIIPNWADGTDIKPRAKADNPFIAQQNLQGKFVVLYAGNFGLTHNLEIIMEAAERLKGTKAFFLFVGAGAKKAKLLELQASKNLDNVRLLPFQPYEALSNLLSAADLSLIVLDKGFNGLSVPSKLYSILASGRGILAALEPESEVAKVLKAAGCGFIVAPDDLEAIVAAISQAMQDPAGTVQMGLNARRYFEKYFDRPIVTGKYYQLLNNT